MEITCTRCHQALTADGCYCAVCGLPQLVYTADEPGSPAQAERWTEAVRDASSIEWKSALRASMLLAVPAALLSFGMLPIGLVGFFWMAAASAWAVSLYVRRQRPAWITMGAGARIGLVTGLMAGWLGFIGIAAILISMRFLFHQAQGWDDMWLGLVNQSVSQQLDAGRSDAQVVAAVRSLLLSPQGRAGSIFGGIVFIEATLLAFAAAGGALGARLTARSRRPEV